MNTLIPDSFGVHCLRRKSNRIRIETWKRCYAIILLDWFKTQIQQNKDWNTDSGCTLIVYERFKTQIQQNKDWNTFSGVIPSKVIWFKTQIQQNKDWNLFGVELLTNPVHCLRRKSNRIRIETRNRIANCFTRNCLRRKSNRIRIETFYKYKRSALL